MRFVSSPILHGPPQRSHFVYLLSHRTFATRTLNISCSLSPLSYSRGHIDRTKTGTSLQQYDPAMENTSGANDPVWVANLPFLQIPHISKTHHEHRDRCHYWRQYCIRTSGARSESDTHRLSKHFERGNSKD